MTPKEILIAADALLSDEDKWCKDAFARTSDVQMVDQSNAAATQWCVEGSINCVARREHSAHSFLALIILDRIAESRGFESCVLFNDAESTTFADIKSLFADAIQEAS